MKLGLGLNDFSWPQGARQLGPTLVRIAQAAEAAGFDRISTVDHVWQSHYLGGPEHEVPSCYPTLTYLAAHTSRIKLLALATASPYWHPVLLAKTVTTLDVLSAGSGEQKTLRLVARYADACNLQPGPQIPQKLEVLRQHCEAVGRDYDTIEKTCAFAFDVGEDGSKVSELIGQLHALAGQGIQTVLGVVPQVHRITPLEVIGRKVIPAVADL